MYMNLPATLSRKNIVPQLSAIYKSHSLEMPQIEAALSGSPGYQREILSLALIAANPCAQSFRQICSLARTAKVPLYNEIKKLMRERIKHAADFANLTPRCAMVQSALDIACPGFIVGLHRSVNGEIKPVTSFTPNFQSVRAQYPRGDHSWATERRVSLIKAGMIPTEETLTRYIVGLGSHSDWDVIEENAFFTTELNFYDFSENELMEIASESTLASIEKTINSRLKQFKPTYCLLHVGSQQFAYWGRTSALFAYEQDKLSAVTTDVNYGHGFDSFALEAKGSGVRTGGFGTKVSFQFANDGSAEDFEIWNEFHSVRARDDLDPNIIYLSAHAFQLPAQTQRMRHQLLRGCASTIRLSYDAPGIFTPQHFDRNSAAFEYLSALYDLVSQPFSPKTPAGSGHLENVISGFKIGAISSFTDRGDHSCALSYNVARDTSPFEELEIAITSLNEIPGLKNIWSRGSFEEISCILEDITGVDAKDLNNAPANERSKEVANYLWYKCGIAKNLVKARRNTEFDFEAFVKDLEELRAPILTGSDLTDQDLKRGLRCDYRAITQVKGGINARMILEADFNRCDTSRISRATLDRFETLRTYLETVTKAVDFEQTLLCDTFRSVSSQIFIADFQHWRKVEETLLKAQSDLDTLVKVVGAKFASETFCQPANWRKMIEVEMTETNLKAPNKSRRLLPTLYEW